MLESKKGAKIIQVELLHGIRTIRLYGDATIEEQGKLSLCYEKNISQDTTCRKDFVIGCTEKILSGFGKSKFVTVFEKRTLFRVYVMAADHK